MDVQNASGNTALHVCALHNRVRFFSSSTLLQFLYMECDISVFL